MGRMDFSIRPASVSDRTYIARLFFLTDVFGDETKPVSEFHTRDLPGYVDDWDPERDGGFMAFDQFSVPAGGIWLRYWSGLMQQAGPTLVRTSPSWLLLLSRAMRARACRAGFSTTPWPLPARRVRLLSR